MSGDALEAIAAILGIAFAGYILFKIGSEVPTQNTINLEFAGALLILLAVLGAIAVIYAIARSVAS